MTPPLVVFVACCRRCGSPWCCWCVYGGWHMGKDSSTNPYQWIPSQQQQGESFLVVVWWRRMPSIHLFFLFGSCLQNGSSFDSIRDCKIFVFICIQTRRYFYIGTGWEGREQPSVVDCCHRRSVALSLSLSSLLSLCFCTISSSSSSCTHKHAHTHVQWNNQDTTFWWW